MLHSNLQGEVLDMLDRPLGFMDGEVEVFQGVIYKFNFVCDISRRSSNGGLDNFNISTNLAMPKVLNSKVSGLDYSECDGHCHYFSFIDFKFFNWSVHIHHAVTRNRK